MKINKTFRRGGIEYSISNHEKEENLFVLKKSGKYLSKIKGYYGGTDWSKANYRFECIRSICTFPNPLDRIAIRDAIDFLEEKAPL